jgi:hypothetical protein
MVLSSFATRHHAQGDGETHYQDNLYAGLLIVERSQEHVAIPFLSWVTLLQKKGDANT